MCASRVFSESKLRVEECSHVDKFMNLGSELRKNFLFILYQLSVDETSFLHSLDINSKLIDEEICICLSCRYANTREKMLGHQISCAHPFSYFVVHKVLRCLWCNDVVYSKTIDGLQSFVSSFASSKRDFARAFGSIQQESTLTLPKSIHRRKGNFDPHLYGIKGMVDFGNTDGMNCILQLFLHAPPIRDFFLSDHHNALNCFVRHGITSDRVSQCFYCLLRELIMDLYAENNDSFLQPVNIFNFFWIRYSSLHVIERYSIKRFMSLFLDECCSTNQTSYPYESSFFSKCIDVNPELTSDEKRIELANLISLKETRLQPKSLLVIPVSDSFKGTVDYPEQNLQIPNEKGGMDCYDLVGIVFEKEKQSHRYYTVLKSSGNYFLFQDTLVWRIESIRALKDMPRILVYLRHFYM